MISGAAVAFAHGKWDDRDDGRGFGPGDGYHMGRGWMGDGQRDCPNYRDEKTNLSDEQIAQIDAARDKFFK
ncbi:MAG: hypothetical protein OQK32_07730, partial [Gammaproteobacteria bacterium]|nr:hypothetical protein [Gammaproteobacteria bacterium]